jgi:hypothetical protein
VTSMFFVAQVETVRPMTTALVAGIVEDDAKLESVGGGVDGVGEVGDVAGEAEAGVGGDEDGDGAAVLQGSEVALEDVADDPYGVEVGDGGDGGGVIERALELACGGADVEYGSGDGGADGDGIGGAVLGEAVLQNALAGTLELGVSGFVGGFEIVEVGLGEDVMLEQEGSALEGTVGTKDFDLCFFEVGAGRGDVGALKHGDGLALLHLLAGEDLHVEDSAGERRKDADNVSGVRHDVRWDVEIVDAGLGVHHHGLGRRLRRGLGDGAGLLARHER